MVTTGESGAAYPLNASCPSDHHMLDVAVLRKVNDLKVSPQSSNLKLGFCVIVICVPIDNMSFLKSLGDSE